MKERNAPCPCGSGKKFKHCCVGKKPRVRSVTVDMGKPQAVDAVALDPATGEVHFLHQGQRVVPAAATTEIKYPRKKGDKILNQAALPGTHLVVNPNRALERYSLLFAIDTNTKKAGGEAISLTCVVLGHPLIDHVPGHTAVRFGPRQCIEFRGATKDHERIGWWEVIGGIQRNPAYNDQLRVGLIVDAHLGLLAQINSGEEPIFADMRLPPNMTMLYASSDTPNDSIANKMLALADKEATTLLKEIIATGSRENLTAVVGRPYSHTRQWNL